MNIYFLILSIFKFIILAVLFTIIFTILIQYINYNYSLPKSLLAYINKLSDFFRKLRFKLFIKKERIRLSNKNLRNILNYYKLKQIILREINLLNDKIYIYFNQYRIKFSDDPLTRNLSNSNYILLTVLNSYGLNFKDLIRITYLEIMSRPNIYNRLGNCTITLYAETYIESGKNNKFEIFHKLKFNENSSFNDIYSQIIELWYLNPDYYDLDNIYKLEIHIKQNK
jgi:hypothetical protein